jgi:DNA invertase Pin-like site-specific DNA recombinase
VSPISLTLVITWFAQSTEREVDRAIEVEVGAGRPRRIEAAPVDTSTPSGEMMSVLATFAQFERRLIGQRTKAALAMKKAAGVRLGRLREIPEGTVSRISDLYHRGFSVAAIARKLNEEGVPTPRACLALDLQSRA